MAAIEQHRETHRGWSAKVHEGIERRTALARGGGNISVEIAFKVGPRALALSMAAPTASGAESSPAWI